MNGGRTVIELLRYGGEILAGAGVTDASWDAFALLEAVTGFSRARVYAYPDDVLKPEEEKRFLGLIRQRAEHMPLQYLLGEAFFMGYSFAVRPGVLIPRQDTERLTEEALACIREIPAPRILDLCTGSGCILLSLCKERKDAIGVGVDSSEEALAIARENRERLCLDADRVTLMKGDVLAAADYSCFLAAQADLIVSNPPYIASREVELLMEEVRNHEPRQALDGGEDGMAFYRRIVPSSYALAKPGGWLLCEIGYDQGRVVSDLFSGAGFSEVEVLKDYAGLDRVVKGRK